MSENESFADQMRLKISQLEAKRDLLNTQIEKMKRALRVVAEAEGEPAAWKGRAVEVIKPFLAEHGPQTYEAIRARVRGYAGLHLRESDRQIKQSLSSSIRGGVIEKHGDLYSITDKGRASLRRSPTDS